MAIGGNKFSGHSLKIGLQVLIYGRQSVLSMLGLKRMLEKTALARAIARPPRAS